MSSLDTPVPLTTLTTSRQLFWVIVALALGGFGIGTTEFVAMGLIQEIAQGVEVSVPIAGYIISAYALGVVVGAPIIAILFARMPRKGLLLALMLFFTLGNAATAFAPDFNSLVISRFIAGLPHGAYFGVAALVAATLAGPAKRAQAVARVMLGLTVATVIGVPFATWLGQHLGWRSGFVFAAAIGGLTIVAIWLALPKMAVPASASIKAEFKGIKNSQMWLTLGIAAIGFGGMFSVYTFVSPLLTHYTGVSIRYVPVALAIWGCGMVVGGLIGGWLADRGMKKALYSIIFAMIAAFMLAPFMMQQIYSAVLALFMMGATGMALGPALQTRLMDVAGEAQTLAASLNHSAFNIANAQGAWLGSVVISAGYGWLAPIWVGVGLSVGGLVILMISMIMEKPVQACPVS
ncbi:MFS transporter [Alkanindiges sp. WGS2144]|uniref:MFS transporter n=1 Tax=Alkanindiges sp. WGS2144 TaxID=3366808 RepID=UPI0037527AB6